MSTLHSRPRDPLLWLADRTPPVTSGLGDWRLYDTDETRNRVRGQNPSSSPRSTRVPRSGLFVKGLPSAG